MEKRRYKRETLNVPCNLYIPKEEGGQREITGLIVNIGEFGVAFSYANGEDSEIIQVGKIIDFISIDSYEVFKETKTQYLTGRAEIIWKKVFDDMIHIGCRIKSMNEDLEQYISDKKVISYQTRLKKMRDEEQSAEGFEG